EDGIRDFHVTGVQTCALPISHRPTETGEVKGKLSYMAPEQVKSKDVDRRADVFSLGCLLYLTTVGRRPFHGDDALATLYQILEKIGRASGRESGVSAGRGG